MKPNSIYQSIPPSEAETWASEAKKIAESVPLEKETLKYILSVSGEPGMTLIQLRQILHEKIDGNV